MSRELQPLRLSAGECRHRLAEAQIFEPNIGERLEGGLHAHIPGEESQRFRHRHFQRVGDRLAIDGDFQYFRPEALAVAIGAAQIDVRQELHLDVFEAVAAAGRAAAVARVEAERPSRVTALFRERLLLEQRADRVERTDVARRIGACGAADRRLIHHHDIVNQIMAAQRAVRAWRLCWFAFVLQERRVKHVLHQRRFTGSGNAGHAYQAIERDRNVDRFEVVFGGAQ